MDGRSSDTVVRNIAAGVVRRLPSSAAMMEAMSHDVRFVQHMSPLGPLHEG